MRARLLLASILAILAAGCGRQGVEQPCAPAVPGSRIEGRVETGDLPVSARVIAETWRRFGDNRPIGRISVLADSTGAYAMDLPADAYRIYLDVGKEAAWYSYAAGGIRMGRGSGDSVAVRAGDPPRRVDFPLGGLEVDLSGLAVPDGNGVFLDLDLSGYAPGDERNTSIQEVSVTASHGRARFLCAGLFPGVYRLKARLSSNPGGYYYRSGEEFWLPATRSRDQADSIRIEPARAALYTAALGTAAHIDGAVIGSWQAMALDGPTISIVNGDSALVASQGRLAGDGGFSFDLSLPEPVRIRVDIGEVASWVGGRSFQDATVFDLQPGSALHGIRVVESGIKVTYPNAWDNTYDQIQVELIDAADRTHVATASWYGARGSFIPLPNLRPGTYLMRVAPSWFLEASWLEQWYDRAASADLATAISIPGEGDLVTVPLTLVKGGSIRGVIRRTTPAPMDGTIYATRADSSGALGRLLVLIHTGRSNPYAAQGLPDGAYKIGVWPGYGAERPDPPPGTIWYPSTADWDSAGVITIQDHADVTGIDFQLP